jgi:hypothetical protein
MIEIKKGSMEERILTILLKKYPITITDLQKRLKVKRDIIERVIKGFEKRGIVTLDVLPDTVYIRLHRFDFSFVGRRESQRKTLKHPKGKKNKAAKLRVIKKLKKDEYDDLVYQ